MRKLMLGAALASAVALTSCTTAQLNRLDQLTSQFIAEVQAGAAAACKVIPTVAAITAIFNANASATVASVEAAICAVAPKPSSARFKALPSDTKSAPGVIGTTGDGIIVTGWRVGAVRFGHRLAR